VRQNYFSILILLFALHATAAAQRVYQHEEKLEGQIFLTPQIAIPVENAGYTLLLPENGKAKGLVVFFNANRDPLPSNKEPNLEFYALQHDLGVLYVTTGNRLEFFFNILRILPFARTLNPTSNGGWQLEGKTIMASTPSISPRSSIL